jgi:hypothetical protein
MDGFSLRKLYDKDTTRTQFYYVKKHKDDAGSPSVRAFRDLYYKYIFHSCNSDTVEELFDMVNDPLELTNQINNSAYNSVIQQYRLKYDSMKLAWNDTFPDDQKNCFIKNPIVMKESSDEDEFPEMEPVVYPNITDGMVEIFVPSHMAEARLYDNLGRIRGSWHLSQSVTKVKLPSLPPGLYYFNFLYDGESKSKELIVK